MTQDWTGGYVADIEYVPGFYREQSPAFMDIACLLRSVEPPYRGEGWVYCDLGCGQGMTCLLLAAANPEGQFIGIDFNPAHIARARDLARRMELKNVTFIEASFEALVEVPERLPELDYVALQGVYAWVGEAGRRAIVDLLAARLKPGGIAYVSYNSMPAWASILPYQRLFLEYAKLSGLGSGAAITHAIALADRMRETGAPGLRDDDVLKRLKGDLEKGNVSYLVHEYLNDGWQPLYHADVARGMAKAKLSFVANGTVLDNFPELSLSPQQREILGGIADPIVRETFRDYLGPRSFRRDLFVKGARYLNPARRDERLKAMRLGIAVGPSGIKKDIATPLGTATLEPGLYEPVLDALACGPHSVADLLKLPGIKSRQEPQAVEMVGMLVGSSQALPVVEKPSSAARAACRGHNRVMVDFVDFAPGVPAKALAAADTGLGIHLQTFELFAYGALIDRRPATVEGLVDYAWARLSRTGERLRRDGVAIEDEAETRTILSTELGFTLREAVPVWRHLGLIDPES
ncbi:MAG: methyltransferase domain-containing protein [Alphaproteobacteria bacterium]|nr:methyltransferase domain-containing protein [Alphaproteobacteria bacterium]